MPTEHQVREIADRVYDRLSDENSTTGGRSYYHSATKELLTTLEEIAKFETRPQPVETEASDEDSIEGEDLLTQLTDEFLDLWKAVYTRHHGNAVPVVQSAVDFGRMMGFWEARELVEEALVD